MVTNQTKIIGLLKYLPREALQIQDPLLWLDVNYSQLRITKSVLKCKWSVVLVLPKNNS